MGRLFVLKYNFLSLLSGFLLCLILSQNLRFIFYNIGMNRK